jgi:hypothetical protein
MEFVAHPCKQMPCHQVDGHGAERIGFIAHRACDDSIRQAHQEIVRIGLGTETAPT